MSGVALMVLLSFDSYKCSDSSDNIPDHAVNSAQESEEHECNAKNFRVGQRSDNSLRYVKDDTGRVDEHVPTVPAQVPA